MSIYVVKLNEWFPKGDEKYSITKELVRMSKCVRCKKTPKYKAAMSFHALPWGYCDEIWCSSKCYKRQNRHKDNNV